MTGAKCFVSELRDSYTYKLNILIYYYYIIVLLKFLYFVKILFLWCLSYNSGVSIAFFGTTVQK